MPYEKFEYELVNFPVFGGSGNLSDDELDDSDPYREFEFVAHTDHERDIMLIFSALLIFGSVIGKVEYSCYHYC